MKKTLKKYLKSVFWCVFKYQVCSEKGLHQITFYTIHLGDAFIQSLFQKVKLTTSVAIDYKHISPKCSGSPLEFKYNFDLS